MKKPSKYLHIGSYKCLSTSLQRDFFSKHEQLYHLGSGCNDHNLGYVNDEIRVAVELYLRYAKDFCYQDKMKIISDAFYSCFKEADKLNKVAGISMENLSFTETPDNIDITSKAKRVFDIFGRNTKVIFIFRNQFSMIRSWYRECIKLGYDKSYHEFVNYCYHYKDRNFMIGLEYDKIYKLYCDLFDKENVLIIPFESITDSNKNLIVNHDKIKIIDQICSHLRIDYDYNINIEGHNTPLSDEVLIRKRELNKKFRHDLGNSIYSSSAANRLWRYYDNDLEIFRPRECDDDLAIKNKLIEEARKQCNTDSGNKSIDFSCNIEVEKRLAEIFSKSNSIFSKQIKENLSNLGYL